MRFSHNAAQIMKRHSKKRSGKLIEYRDLQESYFPGCCMVNGSDNG